VGQTDFRFGGASGVAVAKSKAAGAEQAVADLAGQLPSDELALILLFVSPSYDPHQFIAEISRQFDGVPVCGCTTAGELAPDGWDENSVVALAFSRADFSAVVRPILNLDSFRVEDGRRIGAELRQELLRVSSQVESGSPFGLVLIDGLCRREEAVMSAIYASLDDIPIVGGSAGDGMRFERTWVFLDGKAYTNAALLILLSTSLPFRVFKCDNFEPRPQKMVVTEADIENRTVMELNAEPAAQEYSRVVGIMDAKLDPFSFASHPVLVRVGGSYYARSIQRVEPDGSLHFFCAIDEGMVLTAATSRSLGIRNSPLAVSSDVMMLRRILQNLLANAIRYTRSGGVVMGCRRRNNRICVQVSDTGPGIAQAQQEAIFREFQRGEASATDQAGFGLGLSIVRRFATVLGHAVQLSSQVGKGSTFVLELEPADLAEVSDEVHETKLAERQYGGLEGAKILLVENDPSGSEAMAALLEGWGCDVATTRSTAEALLRLSELGGAPDAVIADLHLDHGESGLSAIADIRQQLKLDVPAMIITADYSEKAAKQASLSGLEVLKKPVKPAEMRALLSFLLS